MNNSSEFIKTFISTIEYPLNRIALQNIKEKYDYESINNFINEIIDKITYDVITKAASNNGSLLKTHEIVNAFDYIFKRSPHQVQLDYNKYFKIIIGKLKERFNDVSINVYPPGNIEKRTAIYFDWS